MNMQPLSLWQLFLNNPEWALVIVGILTLIVIAWQAVATANAARATRMSAEALWAGQRAQLAVEAHGNPLGDLVSDHPRVRLDLVNRGMTPAYDCAYESWIEILPRDREDFTPSAEHFKAVNKFPLFPNHGPMVINVPFQQGLPYAQINDIRNGRLTGYVRIRIEYRDARTSGRYVDFGFRVDLEGLTPMRKYSEAN